MRFLADRIRTRIIPAVLTALGITFLAAGFMSYTESADIVPDPSAEIAEVPTASPTEVIVSPSPGATVSPTPVPLITLPPLGSAAPTKPPATSGNRIATRVRIAALKIDLPVVKPPSGYPLCNVAMYYINPQLGQPGQGKSVYLFAHARTGMFLPLLTASKVSNGKKMIGMIVEVWTGDDQRFLYVITDVLRHQAFDHVFDRPFAATSETLWLQTSEGVGTQPKLMLKAEPLSQEAAPHAEAHPKAKPLNCS
ncbi:MAG: hypothetical protein ACJ77U_02960 [Chloroflexota bacterium]